MWFIAGITPCSVTCGTGVRHEIVKCLDSFHGKVVQTNFCFDELKLEPKNMTCNLATCLPRYKKY